MATEAKQTGHKRARKARITLEIDDDIHKIRTRLLEETGVYMTYRQLVDYLIKFYFKHQKAETAWRP
jgi:hypothetical protein